MASLILKTTNGREAKISSKDLDFTSRKWVAIHVGGKYWYVRESGSSKKKREFLHRLIIGRMFPQLMHSATIVVDHSNGDTMDNRRENLVVATRALNRQNSKVDVRSSSGYRGVHWNSHRKQWVARLRAFKADHFMGYFDDPKEAAKAYDQKAREIFGKFARLNMKDSNG